MSIFAQYTTSFYFQYLATWPEYFKVQESASGRLMGYIMGKSEGQGNLWHGHVTGGINTVINNNR
jgi:N-terminal acetyltransferase B complex catalytic subunit